MTDVGSIIIAVGSLVSTVIPSLILWKTYVAAEKRRDKQDAALKDIGTKVDGAHTALLAKVDSLRSANESLRTEVLRLDEPGAERTGNNGGKVGIDPETKVVTVRNEDRRNPPTSEEDK